MKKLALLLLALAASGCIMPNEQRIYHDRNSEAGRALLDLDAAERAYIQRERQAQR